MTTTVYVIGAPAVGKTTLVDALLEPFELTPSSDLGYPPFAAHPMYRRGDPRVHGVYLGRRRDEFSGTDALSMAALPAAAEWAERAPLPTLIVGEGDRLAQNRFLEPLAERGRLVLVYLAASDGTLHERRLARGSQQNPSWAAGRATRARRLAETAAERGWRVLKVWASATPEALATRIREELTIAGVPIA